MKKLFMVFLLTICCTIGFSLNACCADSDDNEIYKSIDDLNGKRIGVQSGTPYDTLVQSKLDNVEIMYVQSSTDGIMALKNGKIDAYVCDEAYGKYIISQSDGMTCMEDAFDHQQVGFAFSKDEQGQDLCDEFNEYLEKWLADGTLDEILECWVDANGEHPVMDLDSLDGEKGTLNYGSEFAYAPFEYIENNSYAGFETEIVYRFCKEAGYKLAVSNLNFDALIPSLTSGKEDFIGSCIAITEERKESVLFSVPFYENDVVPIITAEHAENSCAEKKETGFIASIADSFQKTFIKEDRWKLFAEGIWQTLLITVCSLIFGTLLGFLLYLWLFSEKKGSKLLTGGFAWLMSRMPMVVLLLILFYIVFANSSLSGTSVSIIGFTMVFGGSVFGLLQTGAGAVDPGQMEAGLALGYTRYQAFFKIILPQAIRHCMEGYKEAVVSLIKATAVVGYVAVQDLTKVSDVVRSRTFEAFFPLIVTAIIYLILAELLILLVTVIDKKLFPKVRTEAQIMKGVRRDD